MINQKGAAHLLLIILLIAGLGVAVYLVGQSTNIFPKAYEPKAPLSAPVTPEPTPEPTPESIPFECTACAADIVKSARNRVDAQDNAVMSSCYGKPPSTTLPGGRSCAPADINKDGSIDKTDSDCLKSVYFQSCTATPTPTPTPQAAKRVFVTSSQYTGNLGGLPGADTKCQSSANAASLGGTWKAWLSTQKSDVQSRLNHAESEYRRLDGVVIANNWSDIFNNGGFRNPLNITELKIRKDTGVWTGAYFRNDSPPYNYGPSTSSFDGASSCGNWTSAVPSGSPSYDGYIGLSDATGRQSIGLGTILTCYDTTVKSLYCFEQ